MLISLCVILIVSRTHVVHKTFSISSYILLVFVSFSYTGAFLATTLISGGVEKENGDELELLFLVAGNALVDNIANEKVNYTRALKKFIKTLESFEKEDLSDANTNCMCTIIF